MDELLAELHRRPNSDFRPPEDDPHRIAVFSSGHARDDERASNAVRRNPDRYTLEDTPAAKALLNQDLPPERYDVLRKMIETRTAMAARGQVEIFGMEAEPGSDFMRHVVSPLLGHDAVSHVNRVPASAMGEQEPEQQRISLQASELIRDRDDKVLPDIADPANFYVGDRSGPGRAPPAEKTSQTVLDRVEELDRERAKDEFRRRLARAKKARQERRHRDESLADGR